MTIGGWITMILSVGFVTGTDDLVLDAGFAFVPRGKIRACPRCAVYGFRDKEDS